MPAGNGTDPRWRYLLLASRLPRRRGECSRRRGECSRRRGGPTQRLGPGAYLARPLQACDHQGLNPRRAVRAQAMTRALQPKTPPVAPEGPARKFVPGEATVTDANFAPAR